MQCEFKGVISALPTPYDQSQQIDMESLRKLIRFNIEQNIKGLYVGGSTGEAFLQNVAEREKILVTPQTVSSSTFLITIYFSLYVTLQHFPCHTQKSISE